MVRFVVNVLPATSVNTNVEYPYNKQAGKKLDA